MGDTPGAQVKKSDSIYATRTLEELVAWGLAKCQPFRVDHPGKDCRELGYAIVGGVYHEGLRRWQAAFPTSVRKPHVRRYSR